MSKPTRWSFVCASLVASVGFVLACATGGSRSAGGDDDDVHDKMDAAVSMQKDASVDDAPMTDAPKMVDGSVVVQDAAVQPDAPPSLFCNSNAECTAAGTCCFLSLCVPGTVILSQCFPSN
jgi:hypothetical protein